jgi:nicotinate phosphoribosyltransferase
MAYGYWQTKQQDKEAIFTLFFRTLPFQGGYCIASGLETVVNFLQDLQFDEADLNYLATLTGNDENPLFKKEFLDYLSQLRFTCNVDAVPEGTLVFPHEPLLRVQGSLLQCQLLETALLNILNFQTLVATKASRVCQATQGEPVLEFGLRRAQGIDGALTASRAAYLGGCAATSNVLAGKLYDIPVKGTQAHSWIMSFASETEAFQQYAEAMPNNCIFLVDTYDTLEGVKRAIATGHWLQKHGHKLVGIRLDSGDLAGLSRQARTLLDDAGFTEAQIVASNDLDEQLITTLKAAGAKIGIWAVGTKLVTCYDQPALGGVYKLSAIRNAGETWQYRIKLSEDLVKISNPGLLQVRRFTDKQGFFHGDMIYNQLQPLAQVPTLINLAEGTFRETIMADRSYQDLLIPVLRQGQLVASLPSLTQIRERVKNQLACCPESVKRLQTPEIYPVSLEKGLFELKQALIADLKT